MTACWSVLPIRLFCSHIIESERLMALVVWLPPLRSKRRACVVASISGVKLATNVRLFDTAFLFSLTQLSYTSLRDIGAFKCNDSYRPVWSWRTSQSTTWPAQYAHPRPWADPGRRCSEHRTAESEPGWTWPASWKKQQLFSTSDTFNFIVQLWKQQLFSTSDTFNIIVQLWKQHAVTLRATRSHMLTTTPETTFTRMLMEHWCEAMTRRVNCSVCNNVDNEST